jgi:hypothetical protein
MKVLFGLWGGLGLRICDFRKHHPDHGTTLGPEEAIRAGE